MIYHHSKSSIITHQKKRLNAFMALNSPISMNYEHKFRVQRRRLHDAADRLDRPLAARLNPRQSPLAARGPGVHRHKRAIGMDLMILRTFLAAASAALML